MTEPSVSMEQAGNAYIQGVADVQRYLDIYLDWFKENEPMAYRRFIEAWDRNEMGVQ